jgi:hypothetical protein
MSSLWNQYDELRKEIEVKIEVVKNAKKGSKQQHWRVLRFNKKDYV